MYLSVYFVQRTPLKTFASDPEIHGSTTRLDQPDDFVLLWLLV